jgi:predicted RNase H-like HicB family nuclease
MEKIIMNICASSDSFGAYSENCDGIYAAGNTIEECKKDVVTAIELIKKNLPEEQWPEQIKGEYRLVWHYDVQSLLLYYGTMLSLSGLERVTGIHQKQLWAYMHGRSRPRKQQKERIEESLHRFADELSDVGVF